MLKKKASGSRADKSTTKKKGSGGGVSLDDEDSIDVGLFSSGPAVVKESIFVGDYDYGGHAKPTVVWLLTFGRGGDEDYEQPYSVGKGWKVSADGKTLIAKAGQTGLPKSCNAMRHLVKPLKAACVEADIEIDLASGDPSVLDGLEVVLRRVDQEVRDMKGGKKPKEGDLPKTILEIEEVTGTDGDTSAGKKKKKAKPAKEDEDDEEEEASEEEDEDESTSDDSDDDEDEEDEKPARGKKKPAAKAGKKKPADDEDDEEEEDSDDETEEDEDEAPTEDAVEALIDVVAAGPVKLANLEAKLAKALKGNKQAAAIIELATSTAFLKKTKGWTFDGKVVDADE